MSICVRATDPLVLPRVQEYVLRFQVDADSLVATQFRLSVHGPPGELDSGRGPRGIQSKPDRLHRGRGILQRGVGKVVFCGHTMGPVRELDSTEGQAAALCLWRPVDGRSPDAHRRSRSEPCQAERVPVTVYPGTNRPKDPRGGKGNARIERDRVSQAGIREPCRTA